MKEEMKKQQIGRQIPAFAIVESNTLAVMGLRQLLESAIPSAQIQAFGTFGELQASNPEHFIHFFVSMHIVLANRNFFLNFKHKTIVLTLSNDPMSQLNDFHCLCVNVSEGLLIKELISLQKKDILMESICQKHWSIHRKKHSPTGKLRYFHWWQKERLTKKLPTSYVSD